jgi:hypothetical protein
VILDRKPPHVTATITVGLISCSVAAVTTLLHGDRSLVIGAASFGLAMLVRGVYTMARAFDRWQELQWEQRQRQLGTGVGPDSELANLPPKLGTSELTSEAAQAGGAAWPLLKADPARLPDSEL